jgi:hypothetical protein
MKEPPANDFEVMVPAGADNLPESSAANTTCCLCCSIHSEGESVARVSNPGDQLKRCPGETGEVRSSIRTTAATGTVTGDPGAQWPAGDGLQREDLSYGEGAYLQPVFFAGLRPVQRARDSLGFGRRRHLRRQHLEPPPERHRAPLSTFSHSF